MATERLRVGLIGAGSNTRLRHIPGLQALPGVEIVAVCNRRPESTAAIAREFGVPRTFAAMARPGRRPGHRRHRHRHLALLALPHHLGRPGGR